MSSITRRTLFGGVVAVAAAHVAAWPSGATGHDPDVRTSKPRSLAVGPGGWCWFQAPRATIDPSGNLWLGSTQGTGSPSPGSVDVTQVDLGSMEVVRRSSLAVAAVDDHTSPSVLWTPSGLQVGWAAHARVDWLEVGTLGAPLQRIVRPRSLTAPGRGTSYVSAHLVGSDRWVLYRGERFSWNLLTSADGEAWRASGLVVTSPVAGHRPYLHAASDGRRLHLVVSDGNPSEFRGTSVWYATIDADLSVSDGLGRSIGRVGTSPPVTSQMTPLISGRRGGDEAGDVDGWLCDLRIIDHRPTALLSVRDPSPHPSALGRWRHELRWARQRASGRWTVEHLAWAGGELYVRQPDYCGLASLDPTDATRVVISTTVHPATGRALTSTVDGLVHHELFEGRRIDEGRWRWTPLTSNSTEDNLRPVVVAGGGRRATAWMRGTYRAWNDFTTQLVVRNT